MLSLPVSQDPRNKAEIAFPLLNAAPLIYQAICMMVSH